MRDGIFHQSDRDSASGSLELTFHYANEGFLRATGILGESSQRFRPHGQLADALRSEAGRRSRC